MKDLFFNFLMIFICTLILVGIMVSFFLMFVLIIIINIPWLSVLLCVIWASFGVAALATFLYHFLR